MGAGDIESRKLADQVINISGFRFSTVRIARDYAGGRLVMAAGSHDEPVNTVGIWDTEAIKNADWLVDHKGFKMEGSVTCLEFMRSDNGLLLWGGTSRGSLQLLRGHPENTDMQNEDDDGCPHNKWVLTEAAHACDYHREREMSEGRSIFSGSCSAVAIESDRVLAAGEDGTIWQMQVTQSGSINITSKWSDVADWVAIYDIKYASNAANFFTAGASGGLRMWDVRAPASVRSFVVGGSTYVSVQPVETFLIAGGDAGEISIFDTRMERGPLYMHTADDVKMGGYHSAEVWTIRACGGSGDMLVSCCADGTVMSSLPHFKQSVRIEPLGWHRYSQAVNDVDAFVVDQGVVSETTIIMAVSDSGLLMGEKATGGGTLMTE